MVRLAHGRGDARCIHVMLDGELVELTPLDDTAQSAAEMTRGLGQRFYLKRSFDALENREHWTAHDTADPSRLVLVGKTFPNRDAAIMYAVMKGRF